MPTNKILLIIIAIGVTSIAGYYGMKMKEDRDYVDAVKKDNERELKQIEEQSKKEREFESKLKY